MSNSLVAPAGQLWCETIRGANGLQNWGGGGKGGLAIS
jgi:hypothetical protein